MAQTNKQTIQTQQNQQGLQFVDEENRFNLTVTLQDINPVISNQADSESEAYGGKVLLFQLLIRNISSYVGQLTQPEVRLQSRNCQTILALESIFSIIEASDRQSFNKQNSPIQIEQISQQEYQLHFYHTIPLGSLKENLQFIIKLQPKLENLQVLLERVCEDQQRQISEQRNQNTELRNQNTDLKKTVKKLIKAVEKLQGKPLSDDDEQPN